MEDINLRCLDEDFWWSAGEQAFLLSKGFTDDNGVPRAPIRCEHAMCAIRLGAGAPPGEARRKLYPGGGQFFKGAFGGPSVRSGCDFVLSGLARCCASAARSS